MTCPFSRQDGAYLLGALSPPERRGYEEHLADCPVCSVALSEVAGLPGLLARLPVEAVEPTQPLPGSLLPSLLRAVEAERRRSRRRIRIGAGLAAAAALVIVAVLGTAIVTADDPSPTTTAAPAAVAMTPVADIPIRATVALIDKPWGTEVDLRCTYSGKLDGKRDWVLVAVGRNGKSEQIAAWGVPYGEAKVIGSTSFRSAELASIEVRGISGTTLMRLQR